VKRPAVFLDRDGTIIEDKRFLGDPAGVEVLPTVVDGLKLLAQNGYAMVVVSNQSGIARGYLDHDQVVRVNAEVARQLGNDGVAIDAWYWCSHYDEGCACRKPAPGMIEQALREHPDVELGQNVGIPGILVPSKLYDYVGPEPDYRAASLLDAAEWIVRRGT
jgi:histidinol-phosphate phosphatase family protein